MEVESGLLVKDIGEKKKVYSPELHERCSL